MRWFRRRREHETAPGDAPDRRWHPESGAPGPAAAPDLAAAGDLAAGGDLVAALGLEPLACATCGRLLDGDPDEDPVGESGRPICGECERNRNFDAMREAGELD